MMKISKITKIINLILLMIIFIIHLSETVGITSLHPGYNGEAEFNTWDTGSPVITFPFINTKSEWKWQTEIVVQNVGVVSNNISFKSYDLGGSLVGNQSIQLNPGANQIYAPPTNFIGSLVLTGTQPLTAMAVGANLDPAWSGNRLISYKGAKIGSGINHIQLYPIQKNNNGWNSILAVQNQEGLGAAAITLNFTNLSDGVTTTLTDSLPAYSSKYYDISGFTILGDSFNGSVDIQADQTVTGVVISSNPLSGGGALAYNPIWSGSGTTSGITAPVIGDSVFFPRIVSESILTVHNISSAVGNYIIEFYYMNGAQFNSDGFTIPAGGYYNYPVSESIPPGVLVSAVIHSDQMMAAVVSTKWPNSSFTCTGYKGITTPSTTAFVPFISKNNLNTITRVGVQNTGSTTTDCTIQYFDESGALAGFEAATIQPSAYHDFDQAAAAFLPDGFKGSAVINSIQPIAVVGFISRNSRNIVTAQSIYMPLVLSKYYKPSCPGGPGSPPILYSVTISPNSGPIDTFLQINLIFFEFHFNDPNGDMGSGTFNWDFPPGQVIRHQLPENLTGITSGPVFFIHRIVTSNQKRYLWYSNVAR